MDAESYSLDDIPGALSADAAGGVVNWSAVHRHLEVNVSSDPSAVCTQLAKDWLRRLGSSYSDEYRVYESSRFVILSARGARITGNLARLGTRTLEELGRDFPTAYAKPRLGKFACIVADNQERYYDYLEQFISSGDLPLSGGVFLAEGYAHFVLNHDVPAHQEFAFVHELTHALLLGMNLPLWLEEGLTQLTEARVLGFETLHIDREEVARHRSHWLQHGIQGLWNGSSFSTDEGMQLSYTMAQVIVRNMINTSYERFLRFVDEASRWDGGDAASRSVFQRSLGEWATQFLGPGEWEVGVGAPHDHWYRALSCLEEGRVDDARQHLIAAVASDSPDPLCLNDVAWVLATHPDDRIRDGSEAVRLAEQACALTDWKVDAYLGTLAAAYAERGDFEKAVHFAERTVELAPAGIREEERARLELFRAGRPYRESSDQYR